MKREFYLSVQRNDAGKKEINFGGKKWGDLPKGKANARGVRTGNNLMVVDVDTKDLTQIDSKLIKLLPKEPTVKTAKGYHWYFTMGDDIAQTQNLTKGVDIRNKGGFVFNKYWGKDKNISYSDTKETYELFPKLHKYLKKLHSKQAKRVGKIVEAIDGNYPQFDDGEQHEMIRVSMQEDFKKGLSYDQVFSKGQKYIKKYLSDDAHEKQLMQGRLDFAFKAFEGSGSSLEGLIVVPKPPKKKELPTQEVYEEMQESGIKKALTEAKAQGSFEYDKMRKHIKEETKLTFDTLDKMVSEEMAANLDQFFNGHICWDSLRGVFMEVTNKRIKTIGKANFSQTVMSRSGYMTPSEVNEVLHGAEDVEAVYKPDQKKRYADKGTDRILNTYYGVKFKGSGKKIPKTIKKVLDNLFLTDEKAKAVFINWMAFIVQRRKRSGVAWGFFGASGTGKGLITDIMYRMIGAQNCSMNVGDSTLQETYNSYVDGKLFVHLNEVASDQHTRHGVAAKLKTLVSDPIIKLRIMRSDPIDIMNYCNVILNSNKSNPIELDRDDRRWNMIVTNSQLINCKWWKGDDTYKKALKESLAFGAYLMTLDVDEKSATTPMLISVAKENVIALTTSNLNQLANHINSGEGLLEFLELDKENIIYAEAKWAEKNRKYSNELLLNLYQLISTSNNPTVYDMNRYLKRALLKGTTNVFDSNLGQSKRGLTYGLR